MKKISLFLAVFLVFFTQIYSQAWLQADKSWQRCLNSGALDSALFFAEQSAAEIRGASGENVPEFANSLAQLSASHFYLGNYSKAKYFILKEILLRESLKITKNIEYVNALENASIIFRKAGNYEESLQWIKKAEVKGALILGKQNSDYADVLCSFAAVYNDMGSAVSDAILLKKAHPYFLEADQIYKNLGDKYKQKEIFNLSNFASYNNNLANYPLAESIFLEIAEFCRINFGQTSIEYANALNNLGVLAYNRANYKKGENYFSEVVKIYLSSTESKSINAAICINNLAGLYIEIGNYKASMKLFKQSENLLIANGVGNYLSAIALNNKAAVILENEYFTPVELINRKNIEDCDIMLKNADTLFEQFCQLPYPEGNIIRYNLALSFGQLGDKTTFNKMIMDFVNQTGFSLYNVISLINKMPLATYVAVNDGVNFDYAITPTIIPVRIKGIPLTEINDSAVQANRESQTISTQLILKAVVGKGDKVKDALGPYNPEYARLIAGLAILYYSIGDEATEEKLKKELLDILIHNTLQDFSFLSESEKEMYMATRMPGIHDFIIYSSRRKRRNPAITGYTYNLIMQSKGLMLKSNTAMRLSILNSKDVKLIEQYDKWINLQKEISALYSTPVEFRKNNVDELEAEANLIEKNLIQGSQDFSNQRNSIRLKWEDIRGSLNPNEAAIEFTNYNVRNKNGVNQVFYCALILKANSKYPEMIKLFEENELVKILGNNPENNLNYIEKLYGNNENSNGSLYTLIWQPLEKSLVGINKIYLSPSGLLHKISFSAITKSHDIYLCDQYQIQMESSTANIIKKSDSLNNNELSALLFGGIQYGNDENDMVWNYLQGTKDEAQTIKEILEKQKIKVQFLDDILATETFLKQNATNYRVVHIATHGFSFPDPSLVQIESEKQTIEYAPITFRGISRGIGVNSFVNSQNPLMRSGLALAGANEVWAKTEIKTQDDGVLTAQEVTQIDMRKTELIVLSACETGLGEIKGSEGVYGLQRAFKMAGVKYIISSLWQVPDKETVEFMTIFYTNLSKSNDIRLAFEMAQHEMRLKYKPYFWAAFVLTD